MSVNSFDDYLMSWKPNREELSFPIYYCPADMMEWDIKSGKLAANTKLPSQRELADFLDLNLSTITKAYKLCEIRGLTHAVTGKGAFVTPCTNVPISTAEKYAGEGIKMAVIHPFHEQNSIVRDLTIDILKKPYSKRLFEYSNPLGDRGQILTAARWLSRFGLDTEEHNTVIGAGAQNVLVVILSLLLEAGDRIAVDGYTHPNFISLANLLYLQLVPIEQDRDRVRPDKLEQVCASQNIKGIYLIPSGGNPTNLAFSDARKQEITESIRKRKLIVIEDDNYASLLEKPYSSVALLASRQCICISGLSKPLCPGLRIAYLYLPEQYFNAVEQGMFSQNLKISSLSMEITAEIIQSGLVWKIIQKKREMAMARNRTYAGFFPESTVCMESYYQWLKLPSRCAGSMCESELAHRGVRVFGTERFSVGNRINSNAIRVATRPTGNDEQLRLGLESVRTSIRRQGSTAPAFIVRELAGRPTFSSFVL